MAKITSKYQVTVPRKIADAYNIRPGDEIQWMPAGEVIRVLPPHRPSRADDRKSQLDVFDLASERHRKRGNPDKADRSRDRGWSREDLYVRGRSR